MAVYDFSSLERIVEWLKSHGLYDSVDETSSHYYSQIKEEAFIQRMLRYNSQVRENRTTFDTETLGEEMHRQTFKCNDGTLIVTQGTVALGAIDTYIYLPNQSGGYHSPLGIITGSDDYFNFSTSILYPQKNTMVSVLLGTSQVKDAANSDMVDRAYGPAPSNEQSIEVYTMHNRALKMCISEMGIQVLPKINHPI